MLLHNFGVGLLVKVYYPKRMSGPSLFLNIYMELNNLEILIPEDIHMELNNLEILLKLFLF